jgi:hypothetical protein
MSKSITTTIAVNATPTEAFDAINNVSAWWGQITGTTTAVGDEFVYLVPDIHYCGLRVAELTPGQTVEWVVTGSYLAPIADKQEWTGTAIRFDISEEDGRTQVTFTHRGVTPEVQCYEGCLTAWSNYIEGSLKNLIEAGVGEPNSVEPDSTEGDKVVAALVSAAASAS